MPNDPEHIIWNGKENSVTVYKDTTKLYLKVNSRTAYVNDKPVQLDVAPVNYYKNQSVYIPLRFVSNALGKRVVWDGSTKSILIRDAVDFDKIKDILSKNNTAMAAVSKCKLAMDMDISYKASMMSTKMGLSMTAEIDKAKKAMHMLLDMDILGMDMQTDSYLSNNASYTSDPLSGKWVKKTYTPEEYAKNFDSENDTNLLNATDALSAGLVLSQSQNPDEILLKGDVYLTDLVEKAMSQNGNEGLAAASSMEWNKFYVEVVLDSKTYLSKSIKMDVTVTSTDKSTPGVMTLVADVVYSDYGGSFEVVVPEDVLKNAGEA